MKSIYKEKLLKEIETIPEHHLKSVYKIIHEFKKLSKKTGEKYSLKGIWQGSQVSDELISKAKKSLFPYQDDTK